MLCLRRKHVLLLNVNGTDDGGLCMVRNAPLFQKRLFCGCSNQFLLHVGLCRGQTMKMAIVGHHVTLVL